ncbi:hypothetical protein AB0I81_39885 [Nonomuraea sp. NPDC050404]|uniref:hypothetical protein n=1 Tax=Nonomuraea sp. NPDC050404 TaxID=3155783 RepID=UPI003404252D
MKHCNIVLASADRLRGKPVGALLPKTGGLTVLIDRDQIDKALIRPLLDQTRERLGHLQRRISPTDRPALTFHLVSADVSDPGALDITATDTDVWETLPRDACTPELMRYAAVLGSDILRWFQPTADRRVSAPLPARSRAFVAPFQAA